MTEYLPRDTAEADLVIDVASDIVRVVRGEPDEVELAALVAGILAAAAGDAPAEADDPARHPWADHARRLHTVLPPGPGTWRWSLHP